MLSFFTVSERLTIVESSIFFSVFNSILSEGEGFTKKQQNKQMQNATKPNKSPLVSALISS